VNRRPDRQWELPRPCRSRRIDRALRRQL